MYLLTMIHMNGERKQMFIQLRDEHLRLMGFFHQAKLEQYLQELNLSHLQHSVREVLNNSVPGKLYFINHPNL